MGGRSGGGGPRLPEAFGTALEERDIRLQLVRRPDRRREDVGDADDRFVALVLAWTQAPGLRGVVATDVEDDGAHHVTVNADGRTLTATVATRTHPDRPHGCGNAERWRREDWVVTELQPPD